MLGIVGVAAYFAYEYFFPATTTAATGTAPTGCLPPNMDVGGECLPPGSGSPTQPAQTISLANLFTQFAAKVKAANDPAVTTANGTPSANPDVFNYYLAQVFTPAGTSPYGWPPDAARVFPGTDRTQPMTITTYWTGVSGYLSSQMGMSGLGIFHGLGMIVEASRRWPEVAGPWPHMFGAGRAVQ